MNLETKVVRRRLSTREQFHLSMLVQAEYSGRKEDDGTFAVWASGPLGFPVTSCHVAGVRRAFGIPSTREAHRAAEPQTRLDGLEGAVEALLIRVQTLEDLCANRSGLGWVEGRRA